MGGLGVKNPTFKSKTSDVLPDKKTKYEEYKARKREKMKQHEASTKNGRGARETNARREKQWNKQSGETTEAYFTRLKEKKSKIDMNVEDALNKYGKDSKEYRDSL